MHPAFLSILSILAYIGGLVIIVMVTPKLFARTFDDLKFVAFAALDIVGALCVFGGVTVISALSNGHIAVRVLNFVLLTSILVIAARMAALSFRPRKKTGTYPVSRVMAGFFCLFLAAAALVYIVQLFRF